jgi:guanylate kinase
MHTGNLFLVSAPSGAGKTSIVNAALAADPQLVVAVSHTTRPARGGEVDGKNYHFVSDDGFSQMIDNAAFLEHANVFGKRYGTSKAEVANKRERGQDVILEIDWQGAQQVRLAMPQAIGIFILPPSVEALAQRLTSRGEDTQQSIAKRLSEAKLDISQAQHFDYWVVNEDFDTAVQDFVAIVRTMRLQKDVQLQHPHVQTLVHFDG